MPQTKRIYMDYHATTPLDPAILKAMMPYLTQKFGNASSRTHAFGNDAAEAVEKARTQVANIIGAEAREIVFTSGATESNNLALKGVAEAYKEKGRHIVSLEIEHKSVLDPLKRLEMSGFKVTYVPVQKDGIVRIQDIQKALRPDTILISVMAVNNEIGTIQPIQGIGKIAKEKRILFHCDAVQAVGKIPVDVLKWNVDLLTFTAHKIYGPKGIGALYLRKKGEQLKLMPQIDGGGHEGGFRSGTLNVPGIVGFGMACELSEKYLKSEHKRILVLKNHLEKALLKRIPGSIVHGDTKKRIAENLNISFPNTTAQKLIAHLKNVAVSSGSACTSTSIEPSYVLKAMGVPEPQRRSSVRISLGRFTTSKEVNSAAAQIIASV